MAESRPFADAAVGTPSVRQIPRREVLLEDLGVEGPAGGVGQQLVAGHQGALGVHLRSADFDPG